MRVDVLSTPGIKAWASTMPATDSSRHNKLNGAEANGLSDSFASSRNNTGNGCRVKDRCKLGSEQAAEKVFQSVLKLSSFTISYNELMDYLKYPN